MHSLSVLQSTNKTNLPISKAHIHTWTLTTRTNHYSELHTHYLFRAQRHWHSGKHMWAVGVKITHKVNMINKARVIVLVYAGNYNVRVDLAPILKGQIVILTAKRTCRLKHCDIYSSLMPYTSIHQCFLSNCVQITFLDRFTYFDV